MKPYWVVLKKVTIEELNCSMEGYDE